MCAADKCHAYNKNWACPPACGSLEEWGERFAHYTNGFVFQTIAHMEDDFDFEAIESAAAEHKRRFHTLVDATKEANDDVLLLSAGSCEICPTCTCPDAPCRFPDRAYPSMESTGLLVSAVCTLADVPYFHGRGTVAFCSAALY
jgi:predicted metal-binding protein